MRALIKLTWVELKLFVREPIILIFTFALPFMFLFVMGEVFGNTADPEGFRGVGAIDYYVPAYIGLVVAAVGLISLPVHLVGYRERGVLRRLRASSVSVWGVVGAQVIVTLLIAVVCGVLLGSVLPTTRAAQGVGLLLFFVMMMLSGTAAPRRSSRGYCGGLRM